MGGVVDRDMAQRPGTSADIRVTPAKGMVTGEETVQITVFQEVFPFSGLSLVVGEGDEGDLNIVLHVLRLPHKASFQWGPGLMSRNDGAKGPLQTGRSPRPHDGARRRTFFLAPSAIFCAISDSSCQTDCVAPFVISPHCPINLLERDLLVRTGAAILCRNKGLVMQFPNEMKLNCSIPHQDVK